MEYTALPTNMPYSLSEAIGHNYKQPRTGMTEGLIRGFQLNEQVEARKQRAQLIAQQQEAKEAERLAAMGQSLIIKGIHPAFHNEANEDVSKTLADVEGEFAKTRRRTSTTNRMLTDAKVRQFERIDRSKALHDFDRVPPAMRTPDWENLNKALYESGKGDYRNVDGVVDPLTGAGFVKGKPVLKLYKPIDHNKAFGEGLARYKVEYEGAEALGQGDRLIQLGPPEAAAKSVAEGMIQNPDVYYTYFDENRDYVTQKYGKNEELLKQGPLRDNPVVKADLTQKFLVEKLGKGALMGKVMKDGSPTTPVYDRTPDQLFTKTPISIGGGGGRETFNKKYKTTYTAEQWKEIGGMEGGETSEYVAIAPKTGNADTESVLLSISGKPFKPQAYKIVNGKVYAAGAIEEKTQNGFNAEGEPKYTFRYVPKKNIPLDDKSVADVAAHYHFSDVNKFKVWIGGAKPPVPAKAGNYTSRQQAALSAFEKKFGRKPTATEQANILTKYK